MSNIEFLRAPVYISATNMVTPLATISFDKLYTSAIVFANFVLNIVQIVIQTASFMMKEGFYELYNNASSILTNLTIEKIVYILVIYNLLILTAIDKQRRKNREQNQQMESLEKQINYLKKTERIREELDELWLQDVRRYHQETNNKMTAMEKKIKKFEKDLKQYE